MRLLFVFILTSIIISCNTITDKKAATAALASNDNALKDSANFTSIQWIDSLSKNFGKIQEGQKLAVTYSFKNIGNKPLIIGKVQPSCGCTIAEQPTEPIAPGQVGEIKASFNSEGRVGPNHKTLFVTANTKGTQSFELHFDVEVLKKKW